MIYGLWAEPLMQKTAWWFFVFIMFVGSILLFKKKTSTKWKSSWLTWKAWFMIAPLVFLLAALPDSYFLIVLTLISLQSCKTFFKIVGMYHRSYFVWMTYISVILSSLLIYLRESDWYFMTPYFHLILICLIPIIRNSYKFMVQYLALSFIGFCLFGFGFLHLGRLAYFPQGHYLVLFIFILTSVSVSFSTTVSRFFGKHYIAPKLSRRISFEGLLCTFPFTILVSWFMRPLLIHEGYVNWLVASLIIVLSGHLGRLTICTIKSDLGIKESQVFVLSRHDTLYYMDKVVFAAPLFFVLQQYFLNAG